MTLSELQTLRRQLESAVPKFQTWADAQGLYGLAADADPASAPAVLAAKLDWLRPQTPQVLSILAPHLDDITMEFVMNFAVRGCHLELMAAGWNHASRKTQLNCLRSAAIKRDTDILDWVIEHMDPTPEEYREGLFSAVWQGDEAGLGRLIPLAPEPWRIVEQLRKKGDPARLLAKLDECWASALDEGNASVPDGRVLTPKFRASLPKVSVRAAHHRLSNKIKPSTATSPHPRPRF